MAQNTTLEENGGMFLSAGSHNALLADSELGDKSIIINKQALRTMLLDEKVKGFRMHFYQNPAYFDGIHLVITGTDGEGRDLMRLNDGRKNPRDYGNLISRADFKTAIDARAHEAEYDFTFGVGAIKRLLSNKDVAAIDFVTGEDADENPTIIMVPVLDIPIPRPKPQPVKPGSGGVRTIILDEIVNYTPQQLTALRTIVVEFIVNFQTALGIPVYPTQRNTVEVDLVLNLKNEAQDAGKLYFTEIDAIVQKLTRKASISNCVVGNPEVNTVEADFQISKAIPSMGDLIARDVAKDVVDSTLYDSKVIRFGRNILEKVISCDQVKAVKAYLVDNGSGDGDINIALLPVVVAPQNTVVINDLVYLMEPIDEPHTVVINDIVYLKIDGDEGALTNIPELKLATKGKTVALKPSFAIGETIQVDD